MPISRRGFLGLLIASPLARFLPARVPLRPKHYGVSLGTINELTARRVMPGMVDNVFRSDPLLAVLKRDLAQAAKTVREQTERDIYAHGQRLPWSDGMPDEFWEVD